MYVIKHIFFLIQLQFFYSVIIFDFISLKITVFFFQFYTIKAFLLSFDEMNELGNRLKR